MLYLDQIELPEEKYIHVPDFLIKTAAKLLQETQQRNWLPILVKEVGKDRYAVIGNAYVYAVAVEAGLERVWCIVVEDSPEAAEVTQVLARERVPKVNLSTASRDEIRSALEYLKQQSGNPLSGVDLAVAVNRIDEAPRQYWQTLDPVADLKCGITKGKKLDALEEVFYLTPQPMPDQTEIRDLKLLNKLKINELKALAKKRGLKYTSKIKKLELVKLLSQ
ncbi:MAG: Rho termination factor N-terminal domain-containing protein [Cyanobacteriota bacterium]